MPATLVDSNVLIDIITEQEAWIDWSAAMVSEAARAGHLCINPIIYAEVSSCFDTLEDLDRALPITFYRRVELPWAAGFLAGHAYVKYRRRGGTRRSPLSDFYIGAHAAMSGFTLLTRDARRYREYFPTVRIIAP